MGYVSGRNWGGKFSRRPAAALLLAVLGVAAPTAQAAEERASVFVLAVAESESFERDLPKLHFASDDADRFTRVMTATGQIPADRIVTLKEPTLAGVRLAFEKISALARAAGGGAKPRFVFYYTGHSDASGLHLLDGLLKKSELHALIASVPAETKIAFFDACYSGAMAAKGVKPAADFVVPKAEIDEPSGSVYFAATSASDVAFEVEELHGSLFTHHLVAGLYGDADTNKDGIVTVDELYQYVYRQMEGVALALPGAHAQKPEYRLDLSGRGALVMAYIARTTSPVVVGEGVVGDLSFATVGGLQTFKMEKHSIAPASLLLVPGEYAVTLRRGDDAAHALLLVVAGREAHLDRQMLALERAPNLDVVAKGARTASRFLVAAGASGSSYERWGPSAELGFASPAERIEASEWRLVATFGARKNALFYRTSAGEQTGSGTAASFLIGARGAFFSSGSSFGFAGQEWQFAISSGADYLQQHWDEAPFVVRAFDPFIPKVAIGFGTSFTQESGHAYGVTFRREFPFAKNAATGDVLAFGSSLLALTAEW